MKSCLTMCILAAGIAIARVEPPLPAWEAEELSQLMEDRWMAGGVFVNFENMERMMQGTAAETKESIPDGESESARAFPRKKKVSETPSEIPSWMRLVGGIAAAGFGGLLILWCAVAWWRNRVRFRFPEFEVEPRLGGSHAAGIGAVISFGSSAVPPAMQRNRVPDYMRRA
jgi:hypothetical protein